MRAPYREAVTVKLGGRWRGYGTKYRGIFELCKRKIGQDRHKGMLKVHMGGGRIAEF